MSNEMEVDDKKEVETKVDDQVDLSEKVRIIPEGSTEDGKAMTIEITDEDHTLGNALRYLIMKNPRVEFCGYSIPHPSEAKMNIRIQTYEDDDNYGAMLALKKGLKDLADVCDHIEATFIEATS